MSDINTSEKDSIADQGVSGSTNSVPSHSIDTSLTASGSDGGAYHKGFLTVRLHSGRNLNLPPNTALPAAIQQALGSGARQQLKQCRGAGAPESLQRKKAWWLPYAILQFDKQEVIVDALEGEISAPVWKSKVNL